MSVSRGANLTLYRDLLRAARGFTNYNFRDYALRRVREEFREARAISTADASLVAYQQGRQQLDMLRRQATISGLFPQEKHAME